MRATSRETFRKVSLIAAVALVLGGSVVLARPFIADAIAGSQEPEGEAYVAKTSEPVTPVIVIRCYENGFVIPEGLEELPTGDCTVVIRNRSGFDTPLGIEFSKTGESPIVSRALPWGQDLVFTVTLEKGSVELKETSRPDWSKELTVVE